MSDKVLVILIVVLLLAAWVLRFALAKAKKEAIKPLWAIQGLIFPVALIVTEIIYETTGNDYMFGVVFFCIAEELLCWWIRKRQAK